MTVSESHQPTPEEIAQNNPTYYVPQFPIGEGKTDYEKYIRTYDLLRLQKTKDEVVSDQEMLFQVTHQAAELWMKIILDELDKAIAYINKDDFWAACRALRLACGCLKLLVDSVDMLGQNLSIHEYGEIRKALGQGSGMESPGFNWLLGYQPKLWEPFVEALARHKVDLRTIYVDYRNHMALHTLAEYYMDYDDLFHKWRTHHVDLVARTIGTESNSLKGLSTQVLQKGAKHRMFPELLQLRSDLTNESKLAYGGNPL